MEYKHLFDRRAAEKLQKIVHAEFDYKLIDKKTRLLSLIAAGQASAVWKVLKGLIGWASQTGVDGRLIYEVLLQGYLFCGYPIAIESLFVFYEIYPANGLSHDNNTSVNSEPIGKIKDRGFRTAGKIYGKNLELVHRSITGLSPELGEGMIIEGYGKIISRPYLDIRTRELAIISNLTVLQMPRQLYSHIRGAINVGVRPKQVESIIRQCGLFISQIKVQKALRVCEKSLGNKAKQG
jgi:4-carboxymuconolactone decarboxylase